MSFLARSIVRHLGMAAFACVVNNAHACMERNLGTSLIGDAVIANVCNINGMELSLNGATQVGNSTTLDMSGELTQVWDTTAWSTTQSFTTSFDFWLEKSAGFNVQGNGVALAFKDTPYQWIPADAMGGYSSAGYYSPVDPVGVAVAVETGWNNTAGFGSAGYDLGSANFILGVETVTYDATNHILSSDTIMSVDGTFVSVDNQSSINLQSIFGNSFYAGVTAASGLAVHGLPDGSIEWSSASQFVSNWQVAPIEPVPEPTAYLLMGLGLMALSTVRVRQIRNVIFMN